MSADMNPLDVVPTEHLDARLRGDDSGWNHPPPPGTVKLRCDQCNLWFSSRGSETCPICVADPGRKTTIRFVRNLRRTCA